MRRENEIIPGYSEDENGLDDLMKMSMEELEVASKIETQKKLEHAKPDETADTTNKYSLEIERRLWAEIVQTEKMKQYRKKGFKS